MGETTVRGAPACARPAGDPRGWTSERGTRRIVFSAVIVPLLLACAGTGWLVWQTLRIGSMVTWIQDSEQVVDKANELLQLFLDQETGLRGFLITGDRVFLEPYEQAHPHEAMDALERSLLDRPRRLALVRAMRGEYLAWEQAALDAIAEPEPGRRRESMLLGKDHMDRIRALVAEFMMVQEDRRAEEYVAFRRQSLLAALGAASFFALLGGAAALGSRRQIRLISAALAAERAAATAKDVFLATLGHELRTPLTPILGWARLMRTRPMDHDARDRALAMIERNARTEAQLIEDVLDTASIAAGKLNIAHDAVDPCAVAREAADVVRLAAEERGVLLDVRLDPGVPEVIGDARRLQQVTWNLLTNAVKFTPCGGRVELSVDRDGSSIRIRVADEGQGIAPEKISRVFDRFWQVDCSPARRHGGLGLGLAIVKDIVALHGGAVSVGSGGLGCGAVFTVTLPVAAVLPPGLPAANGTAAPSPSLGGKRVLVVDDDACARELLAAVLVAQGAEVLAAESVCEALSLLADWRVDVLISDIGMPGRSGYDLIAAIRGSRQDGLPALALSAYASPADVQRALDAGFQGHLAKPVDVDNLVGMLARLCEAPLENRPGRALT